MNIYKCTKVVIGLFLLNLIEADEIEYFWSGAVTPESAVISFATDKKAKIKIQYSESKNFKKNKDVHLRGWISRLWIYVRNSIIVKQAIKNIRSWFTNAVRKN